MHIHLPPCLNIVVQHFQRVLLAIRSIRALHHFTIDAEAQNRIGNFIVVCDGGRFRLTVISSCRRLHPAAVCFFVSRRYFRYLWIPNAVQLLGRVHTSQSHPIPNHIIIQLESKHEEWTKKNSPPTTTLLLNLTRKLITDVQHVSVVPPAALYLWIEIKTRGDKHVHVHVSLSVWTEKPPDECLDTRPHCAHGHTYASIPHYIKSTT